MFTYLKRYIVFIIHSFCFILVFTSCTKKNLPNSAIVSSSNQSKKILALGDSYSIGQSVTEQERFINQTISIVRSNSIKIEYPAKIIAQTGWTTKDLLNAIAANSKNLTVPYDIVTLLIGVNNQYQQLDTAMYSIEFTRCLHDAITLTGNRKNRVFVLSIPDYGATPFGIGNAQQIGKEIDWFNNINKQICSQMGIDYIDITPSTRMAATDITLVANDGLHPSGKEYFKWAKMLAAKVLPLLQ